MAWKPPSDAVVSSGWTPPADAVVDDLTPPPAKKPADTGGIPTVTMDESGNVQKTGQTAPAVKLKQLNPDGIKKMREQFLNMPAADDRHNREIYYQTLKNNGFDVEQARTEGEKIAKFKNPYIQAKTVFDQQPDNAQANFDYANILLKDGQTDEAMRGYQRILRMDNDVLKAQALHALDKIEKEKGNERGALKYLPEVGGNVRKQYQNMQPGNNMTFNGDNPDEMVSVGSQTNASTYLNGIADAILRNAPGVGGMQMIAGGIEKLGKTDDVVKKEGGFSGDVNNLVGVGETLLGAVNFTGAGAMFMLPFEQVQNNLPPDVSKYMAPAHVWLQKQYDKEEDVPAWANNVASITDFAILAALAHGAHVGAGEVKARGQARSMNKILDELPQETKQAIYKDVEARAVTIPQEEYASQVKDKVLNITQAAKEVKVQQDVAQKLQEPPAEVKKQPIFLKDVKADTDVMFEGKTGKIDRGDDGTWYFDDGENPPKMLKVEDKNAAHESPASLGLHILPDVPHETIMKAMADREQVGEVEYKGNKYFVSAGNKFNPADVTGDIVGRIMSDGSIKDPFTHHPDETFAKQRKLAILNEYLKSKGLPERKQLYKGKEQSIDVDPEKNIPENAEVKTNEEGNIVVRDKIYKNEYTDQLSAINYRKDGSVKSVELNNEKGERRSFTGETAKKIAEQIELKNEPKAKDTTGKDADQPKTGGGGEDILGKSGEPAVVNEPEAVPGAEPELPTPGGAGVPVQAELKMDENASGVEQPTAPETRKVQEQPDVHPEAKAPVEDPIDVKIDEQLKAAADKPELKGKDKIASGIADLVSALGLTQGIDGGKRPEVTQALVKIGQGLIEMGLATAENVTEKIGEYIKDKFDGKVDLSQHKEEIESALSGARKYDDPETSKMANAINDAYIEGKFGAAAVDHVISKLQDTDLTAIYTDVRTKIEKGIIDPEKVRERVMRDQHGSEHDQAAILYDAAELKGKEEHLIKEINAAPLNSKMDLQQQLMDVQNDLLDNALANRSIGRSASSIFRLRQVIVDKKANLLQLQDEYMASKGVDKLTEVQKAEVQKYYTRIRELEGKMADIRNLESEAREANAKLQSENETLKSLNDAAREQRKRERGVKTQATVDNSKARVQKSLDKLRELRKSMNDVTKVIPEVAIEISKIAAEKVYQGAVKLEDVIRDVLDEIKGVFPEFTSKDVSKHLEYVRKVAPRKETSKVLTVLKKTARLQGQEGVKVHSTAEPVRYEKSRALVQAEREYARERLRWDADRRADIMKNRPFAEKAADAIVRWQRFAVLSYPSTMIKLAAVVVHGILLKPLKVAFQAMTYAATKGLEAGLRRLSPGKFEENAITGKQAIYGKPRARALAKYYSEFVRNFSLENLKEHFTGVDAKEAQYGKPFIYDEWKAAKGWIEIPGRSHGYIKSFIKNPEFEFAQEQVMQHFFEKASDIHEELQSEHLFAEQRTKLEQEYKNYDLTNPDVQDRIGKMSVEHGKWSILMNENKISDKFREWTDHSGIGGALIRTELPILKIPLNYIGRHFATKYGLLQALIGKRGFFEKGGAKKFPGLIELMYNGTKDLKPEQADLLGRTITQGSIGASFFVLGYLLKNQIKHNDDGSFEIAGHHVSKNLIHVPEYESIFSGAETAQEHNDGEMDFIGNFVASDKDIVANSPFFRMIEYGFVANLAQALTNKNPDTASQKVTDAVARKLADIAEPGFLKQTAGWLDTKESGLHPLGEPIRRRPSGNNWERFMQRFEMGIPGLRGNVPVGSSAHRKIKKTSRKKGR